MTISRRRFLHVASGAVALPAVSRVAMAQAYPSRPINMVVPFPPGGPLDTVARLLAERMRPTLGQPVIIENVAGANGTLGVIRAGRAPADGYTVIAGTVTTHVLVGALYNNLQLDLLTDFKQIALLGQGPLIMCAKAGVPANTLQELIAWLKANPDMAMQGTAGIAAVEHIAGLLFQKQTGTKFRQVPYRGLAPAMQDLLGGQLDIMLADATTALPHISSGKIKAYAVAHNARLALAPNIPTMAEAGLPGFTVYLWFGLWAPGATPPDIVAKLSEATKAALAEPSMTQRLAEFGQEITPADRRTPEALRAFQKAEIDKWWPIIREAGIKVD